MATKYKIELVSDDINYTEKRLKDIIEEELNSVDDRYKNIRVTKIERCS